MTEYYFECSVGPRDEKCKWVRFGNVYSKLIDAIIAAHNNNVFPYRIKSIQINKE